MSEEEAFGIRLEELLERMAWNCEAPGVARASGRITFWRPDGRPSAWRVVGQTPVGARIDAVNDFLRAAAKLGARRVQPIRREDFVDSSVNLTIRLRERRLFRALRFLRSLLRRPHSVTS